MYSEYTLKAAKKADLQNSGALWNNLGMYLRELADYQSAKGFLERALKIDEAVYGPDHPEMAKNVNNLGSVLKDLGDLQEAQKCFDSQMIFRKMFSEDHSNTGRKIMTSTQIDGAL